MSAQLDHMASVVDHMRWTAIFKHLQDHGAEFDTICKLWPQLTRIPVGSLESIVYSWENPRSTLDAYAKGKACRAPDTRTAVEVYRQGRKLRFMRGWFCTSRTWNPHDLRRGRYHSCGAFEA